MANAVLILQEVVAKGERGAGNLGTLKPPDKDCLADSATISCMFWPLSFGYKGPIKSYFRTPEDMNVRLLLVVTKHPAGGAA